MAPLFATDSLDPAQRPASGEFQYKYYTDELKKLTTTHKYKMYNLEIRRKYLYDSKYEIESEEEELALKFSTDILLDYIKQNQEEYEEKHAALKKKIALIKFYIIGQF